MAKELYCNLQSLKFGHNDEERLRDALETQDKHSVLHPITSTKDITFDDEGYLVLDGEKYRLTKWALFRLCQTVCGGAYKLVAELSGVNRTLDEPREDYSFEDALDILTRILHRRFDNHIQGMMFLKNTDSHTVDGIVSPIYKWLSNYELYNRSVEMMKQLQEPATFFEGALNGRWLLLRYIRTRKAFITYPSLSEDVSDDKFYTGFHFSNNEVSQAAVRSAVVLMRRAGQTAAIQLMRGYMAHRGKVFREKVDRMFEAMLTKRFNREAITANINKLKETWLGLGNRNSEEEQKRADWIAKRLIRHGMRAHIAKRIVGSTIHHGSFQPVSTEPSLFRPVDRTAYDLYNALGREAKSLPVSISQRENMEHFAHSILVGKVNFD